MKKFFKVALLSLVLCFAFVFSACGDSVERQFDSKASVNKGNEASYQATTKDDFVGYVNDNIDEAGLTMSGYRMTGSVSGSFMDEEFVELLGGDVINFNIIVVENNGVPEMAIKITIGTANVYAFVKDGYCYTRMNFKVMGMKFDYKVKSKLPDDYSLDNIEGIGNVVDFEQVFELLNDETTNATITAYTEGETTRYKVEMDYVASATDMENLSGNYVCYYVFESSELTGFSINLTNDQSSMDVDFSKYTGTIEYPDFSDYKEKTA